MSDFVANTSRWKVALLVLGSVTFVAIGAWMIGMFGPLPTSRRYPAAVVAGIGWFCILFCGVCGAAWMRRLFGNGEELRINRDGIRWTRWSDQTIPWSEVSAITEWGFKGERDIVLHLNNPKSYPGRGVLGWMAKANSKLSAGDISISLTGTDRSFEEAMVAIERFRPSSNHFTSGG